MIERERRYLVAQLPGDLPVPTSIEQAYLFTHPVTVRVRRENDHLTLTLKAGSGRNRTEIERELAPDEFAALFEHANELRIQKRRHRISLHDDSGVALTAELDLYDGELSGRSVVEVEFPDDASADRFEPPSWFGREVTTDSRYSNSSLASNGWPSDD